ncbi:MAG TPA: ammonia-forming cytochrome c nitrite reductase subunit c552, partial [Thermoflexales bacterium]|nr:ammonia-forming cytochrome c nitrite reductase subunit c552 [Thermoflexales bacterium]
MKKSRSIPTWGFILIAGILALLTVGVLLLLQNINTRQQEAKQQPTQTVQLTEETLDPAIWGKNYPNEYDSYKRTVDVERTKFGGSEAFSKLEDDVRWKVIFSGNAFGTDYREERGHAYMLVDQRDTQRVTQFKQPGACLHCHAAVTQAYYTKGVEAGAPASDRKAAIQKGFELVNPMPYVDATKLVDHPVTCADCHDPATMQLRITRPGFFAGINALAKSKEPTPHLPSIERWRAA